jgi:hypothetical protein
MLSLSLSLYRIVTSGKSIVVFTVRRSKRCSSADWQPAGAAVAIVLLCVALVVGGDVQ